MPRDHDVLQRFLFEHLPARGALVHLDTAWKAVLERRNYPAPVRQLLGEMTAAAVLLSSGLKFKGSLILQVRGRGPVSLLVVECAADLTLRAMAHWSGEIAPAPLAELIGDGQIVITLDPRNGQQPYQGIVPLEGRHLGEVLQHYMQRSEQLDSRFWLAADGERVAGLMLQRIPGQPAGDDDAWPRIGLLAATIKPGELLGLPPLQIVRRLFHQEDLRVFDAQAVAFHCACTRERVAGMLRMLGQDEVHAMLAEHPAIEVDCEFCSRNYLFDRVDAEQIFSSVILTPAPPIRH